MKRFIALFVVLLLVVTMFTACSSSKQWDSGSYHLVQMHSNQGYLDFLANLDETKYEIVDTSATGKSWFVTYKDIEE